jgi:hypothetical protein
MKTEAITIVEAEAEMQNKAGPNGIAQWQNLKATMNDGDELVSYSDVDVYSGFCSGDEGVALVRNGEVVSKIVLVVVG